MVGLRSFPRYPGVMPLPGSVLLFSEGSLQGNQFFNRKGDSHNDNLFFLELKFFLRDLLTFLICYARLVDILGGLWILDIW